MAKSKRTHLVVTAIFCLMALPGTIGDLVQPQMVLDIVADLGLPAHVLTLVGIWKLLGIVALAQPKFRRINEWAYAGFFFDLTGAAWCHAMANDPAGIVPPVVVLGVLTASYRLRPDAV